jgi:glutamyl-tRNA reductase
VKLISLGLSHATAPLALREHFARPLAGEEFLTPRPGVEEYVVLSTCNRLEVYASLLPEADTVPLLALLEQISGLGRAVFAGYIAQYEGQEAVRHLAQVAGGLDSLVVGESQILGQVAQAYEKARQQGVAGPNMEAVFQAAIRAGKRARSETEIGRNPVSISSVAVRLAQDVLGDLTKVRVLVIGAGEMAGLAIEALQERGVGPLTVINRTLETARELAARWDNAHALPLEQLEEALAEADLVIASSGAPFIVVTPALLERVPTAGRASPLVFIDIAVPRNVSPQVVDLPNIRYFDMDALQDAQDEGRAGRERAIPQVEAIIDEEMQAYREWERQQQIAPLVAGLRARAELIRTAEIERSLRRWPGAGAAERERLEALTEAIVNRLLHHATTYLKAGAGEEQTAQYAAMLQELFALEDAA